MTTVTMGIMVGIFGAMPTTVLSQDKPWKIITTAYLPESWAFFTKDPNATALIALQADANDIQQAMRRDSLPQSLPMNAFGLSRNQRAQDTEKALYAAKVNNWIDCGGMTNEECFQESRNEAAQTIDPAKGVPSLCGRFMLVQSQIVPYAYRESSAYESKAQKVALVEVKC
ncbi:SdpA family antimicrobial peptide system protein [Paenarthrobacter nicotinovorans]|uniref:SdpA family antimicrobial peptide system protein n=1 Tax=Paenarthrobacter nicotinovorans TaxID=29320 RepID=UPI0037FC01A3